MHLDARRCVPSTWHPPRTPPFLSAVCHISFSRGHTHDEITHGAPGPLFIMYEWVYSPGARCPGWGNRGRGSAFVGGVSEEGVAWGGPCMAEASVQTWFLCSVAPGPRANAQPGSASDERPAEVSCARVRQRREGRNVLNSTPVLSGRGGCPLKL